jgi:hypothetical protein
MGVKKSGRWCWDIGQKHVGLGPSDFYLNKAPLREVYYLGLAKNSSEWDVLGSKSQRGGAWVETDGTETEISQGPGLKSLKGPGSQPAAA